MKKLLIFSILSLMSLTSLAIPVPIILTSPSVLMSPALVTLDGTSSTDSTGTITAFNWQTGDGVTSQLPVFTHTYTSPGSYTITLQVSDSNGVNKTTSTTLIINPAPTPTPAIVPVGVHSIMPPCGSVPTSVPANTDIAAITITCDWPTLNPTKGVYNWSVIDTALTTINNQTAVNLAINTGGQATPAWVFTQPTPPKTLTFLNSNPYQGNYNTPITIPVFWDTTYLNAKLTFIKAMGKHYATTNFSLVEAQCANSLTDDWNVPSAAADVLNWQTLGYTSALMIAACEKITDITMTAFPNSVIKMPIGRISATLDPTNTPDYVAVSLIAYENLLHPGRFLPEKFSISTQTPDPALTSNLGSWQVLYNNTPNSAVQPVWPAGDTTTCRANGGTTPCDAATVQEAIDDIAYDYRSRFIEIMQTDVMNSALAATIHNAATTLGTN